MRYIPLACSSSPVLHSNHSPFTEYSHHGRSSQFHSNFMVISGHRHSPRHSPGHIILLLFVAAKYTQSPRHSPAHFHAVACSRAAFHINSDSAYIEAFDIEATGSRPFHSPFIADLSPRSHMCHDTRPHHFHCYLLLQLPLLHTLHHC